jgi:hypothetical protein
MYVNYTSIKHAFVGDNDLKNYCDPDDKDKDVKEIVYSIYRKILDYEKAGGSFYNLKYDDKLIGYFFCYKNILVSFGVNIEHRNKETLQKVFEDIKKKFNSSFETYMWQRNERAVRWLKKCGMEESHCNIKDVTKLKYILCQ